MREKSLDFLGYPNYTITDDGKVQVNDPNSVKNSQKTWELDRIMSQMRDLWVYKA